MDTAINEADSDAVFCVLSPGSGDYVNALGHFEKGNSQDKDKVSVWLQKGLSCVTSVQPSNIAIIGYFHKYVHTACVYLGESPKDPVVFSHLFHVNVFMMCALHLFRTRSMMRHARLEWHVCPSAWEIFGVAPTSPSSTPAER